MAKITGYRQTDNDAIESGDAIWHTYVSIAHCAGASTGLNDCVRHRRPVLIVKRRALDALPAASKSKARPRSHTGSIASRPPQVWITTPVNQCARSPGAPHRRSAAAVTTARSSYRANRAPNPIHSGSTATADRCFNGRPRLTGEMSADKLRMVVDKSSFRIRIFNVARLTGVVTKSTKAKSICG